MEKLGDYREAIENYETTIQIEDPTAHAFLRIGRCYEKLEDSKMAQYYYQETVKEDPLLDKGWLAITNLHFGQKSYAKALANIERALNIDRQNPSYWKKCAEIHVALSEYDQADFAYKQVVDLGDYELEVWLGWARVVYVLEDLASGIEILKQARELYPSDVHVAYYLVGFYLSMEDTTNARIALLDAVAIDPLRPIYRCSKNNSPRLWIFNGWNVSWPGNRFFLNKMGTKRITEHIFIFLKGMAMGIAELVPGVSGGTIAFVTGIYEEFISALNNISPKTFNILRKDGLATFWKSLNGPFLAVLFAGMLVSILSFSKLITWLLDTHPIPVWAFFFGLVFASVFFVAKSISRWQLGTVILFILGTVVAFYITGLPPSSNTDSLPFLFFSGALAICAMVLPGISGSFILVLLGSYKTILEAVNNKDITIVLTVGAGVVFGLLSFARLLKWLFGHYRNATLALLTGFILGSLNKIWPWKRIIEIIPMGKKEIIIDENISPFAFDGEPRLLLAIAMAVVGFSLIFILERSASKK